jgi:6-phosphogluconolactonase
LKYPIRHLLNLVLPVLLVSCGGGDGTTTTLISTTFTISGVVRDMSGTGLILQNNGADDKSITANGAFSFTLTTQIASGSSYSITVKTQPTAPSQNCTVANGTGSLSTANINNVLVICEHFAYVANHNTNDISAYTFDATTGALTSVGAAVAAGTNPFSVTVDPSGKFVYVANPGSNDISAYTIDATTGTLTSVGAAAGAGANPISVTVDPKGKFAYVTNFGSNNVSAYTINATTGVLTSVGAAAGAGVTPRFVTVDPAGNFAYVVNYGSDDISAYTFNAITGVLTQIDCGGGTSCRNITNFAAGSSPWSIAVSPAGNFAYVANSGTNDVSAYTISATGALTPINCVSGGCSGTNFAAGNSPTSITIDPTGKFAYIANYWSNDVSAYTISATGALTPINCVSGGCSGTNFAAGANPFSVTVDPTGKFAYVANHTSDNISVYTIDATTGLLTSVGTTVVVGSAPTPNPNSITTTH